MNNIYHKNDTNSKNATNENENENGNGSITEVSGTKFSKIEGNRKEIIKRSRNNNRNIENKEKRSYSWR